MNTYAVIIGLDRIPTDNDISSLNALGALGMAKKVLYIQVNIGQHRDVLAQSSVILHEQKLKNLAQSEWNRKGMSVSKSNISLGKYIVNDGLFIALPNICKINLIKLKGEYYGIIYTEMEK